MTATFPQAASPAQQPLGLEDEDLSLDEYDLYSLAPSDLDEARARTPHSDGDWTSENRHLGERCRPACPPTPPQDLPYLTEALRGHKGSIPSPRKRTN
ncbi:nuclear protein 1 isoform X1 [Suricata suricatta]|uniref:nuclear protein 1 isoform X1 n=1 Tax=Suricata suricatta TaxID=37032 RepID=UPI0011554E1E|nr:nuclear protein 1 isoform X1 [Suricata suricatta]